MLIAGASILPIAWAWYAWQGPKVLAVLSCEQGPTDLSREQTRKRLLVQVTIETCKHTGTRASF